MSRRISFLDIDSEPMEDTETASVKSEHFERVFTPSTSLSQSYQTIELSDSDEDSNVVSVRSRPAPKSVKQRRAKRLNDRLLESSSSDIPLVNSRETEHLNATIQKRQRLQKRNEQIPGTYQSSSAAPLPSNRRMRKNVVPPELANRAKRSTPGVANSANGEPDLATWTEWNRDLPRTSGA